MNTTCTKRIKTLKEALAQSKQRLLKLDSLLSEIITSLKHQPHIVANFDDPNARKIISAWSNERDKILDKTSS